MALTREPLAVPSKMLQDIKLGARRTGTSSDTEDQGRNGQVGEGMHDQGVVLVFLQTLKKRKTRRG